MKTSMTAAHNIINKPHMLDTEQNQPDTEEYTLVSCIQNSKKRQNPMLVIEVRILEGLRGW